MASKWFDPALKLIDEVANAMDVDYLTSSLSSKSSFPPITIVLDTNVLLNWIDVIQQFCEDIERAKESISIDIPGIVVEELDYQKNGKNRDLWWAARRASTWILSKLKERKHVRGQAYHETLQVSRSWKRRDAGVSNDELIVDYCLYVRGAKGRNILAISGDVNLCNTAESQVIHTLNPRDFARWSSKALAKCLFGEEYPKLALFSDYMEIFRPRRVQVALDKELGQETLRVTTDDDGMEIDDGQVLSVESPPQHLLDDLHNQVLDHFHIVLLELVQRVSPSLFSTSKNVSMLSIHASIHANKTNWETNEILEYLCSPRQLPRSASSKQIESLLKGMPRMINFFTRKYKGRGRSGQHWSRADWIGSLETLRILGDIYGDNGVLHSLGQLAPQLELIFQTPMRPTGTGTF